MLFLIYCLGFGFGIDGQSKNYFRTRYKLKFVVPANIFFELRKFCAVRLKTILLKAISKLSVIYYEFEILNRGDLASTPLLHIPLENFLNVTSLNPFFKSTSFSIL